MWTEEDLKKASEVPPDNFSGIYIGGGNTPYLLKKLKETGMWVFLKQAIDKDIPIYGGSAGAIIFGKSILSSLYHDKNWVDLKNYSGLDILKGREITCHYNNEEKEKILKMLREYKFDSLIALSEKNGLYITKEGITLIGQESATVFEGKKIRKIVPGNKI